MGSEYQTQIHQRAIFPAYLMAGFLLLWCYNIISVCWPGVLKPSKILFQVLVSSLVTSISFQEMKGFRFSFPSLRAMGTLHVLPFAGFASVHWLDSLYACWIEVVRMSRPGESIQAHIMCMSSAAGFCRSLLPELGCCPPLPDHWGFH